MSFLSKVTKAKGETCKESQHIFTYGWLQYLSRMNTFIIWETADFESKNLAQQN